MEVEQYQMENNMKKIITLLGVMFFVVFVAACEAPPLSLLMVQAEQRSITLEVDERLQLLPVLEGVDTNGFLYDSDSILIASVSSTGVLIGLRPGIALIKVTSGDVFDYARVIVIATTKDVVTGLCVTKEVIQDDAAQFVIVCEDGTTVATGITAPAVIESARIVLTEVSEDGELILTYADGEVVNVGNVVGPQGLRGFTSFSGGSVGPQGPVGDIGPQGLVGAKGDTGSSGADGANGVVGETVATARDALDLTALLAVAMIDRIVFTSGIVYDSGVTLLYQETITMGNLYFNSGAFATPTFSMSGLGSHIGDIYVDASSGTFVIGDKIRIVGDVFIQNVDINSFDTSANHVGRIIMLGRGRLNLDPLATVDAVEIDSYQPVLLTGVFDAPITIVSANAQITLGEGVVLKELVIAETASNVTIQVESGVVVTGQGILLQGSAAEPVVNYDSDVTPQESLVPVAMEVRVTNQTTGINYNTIQAAITAALDGDEIIISSGTFYEELLIENKSGLSIRGQGIGNTILGPTRIYDGTDFNNAVTLKSSDYISFSRLTIDGYANDNLGEVPTFRDGIHYHVNGGGNYNHFFELEIKNTDRRAISIFPVSTLETIVENNIIHNVTGEIMGSFNGSIGINFQGTGRVQRNIITEIHTGIILNVDNQSMDAEVVISYNSITNFKDTTVHTGAAFNVGITTFPRRNEKIIIEGNVIESDYSKQIGMYLNYHSNNSIVRDNSITLHGRYMVGIDALNNKNGGYLLENNTINVDFGSTAIALSTLGTQVEPMILTNNSMINLSPNEMDNREDNLFEFNKFFFSQTNPRDVGVLISGSNDTKRVKDTLGLEATFVIFSGTNSISNFANPVLIYSNSSMSQWSSSIEAQLDMLEIDYLVYTKPE